jgi:serine protease Do
MYKTIGLKVLIVAASSSFLLGSTLSVRPQLSSTGITTNISTATGAPVETGSGLQGLPDFVSLAKQLSPAVVNVSATGVNRKPRLSPSPFGQEDPHSEFWERFFGGPLPRGPSRQSTLGSGFILDREGLILTNNHVVENAKKIVVRLSDKREFEAKVVGRDSKTDISVILSAWNTLSRLGSLVLRADILGQVRMTTLSKPTPRSIRETPVGL